MRPREGEELEEVINELEDVGQQLALEFNQEGSLLATGGEVLVDSVSLEQQRMEFWWFLCNFFCFDGSTGWNFEDF